MQCENKFEEIYHIQPEATAFCPYRICPIGAHVDHNYGKILGFAIDKGIHLAYKPVENGIVELKSLQFDKRVQWHVNNTPDVKQNDWADYLRGATLMLSKKYDLHCGLYGVIEGTLPIGGLSSSAAVTIVYLDALCKVNGIKLSPTEMIQTALDSENKYVGVSCGKLDQSCEVYCKKDNILYLDTMDDSYELIPAAETMKPYDIAIFFSGVERTLVGSKFNMRVDELRSAAYALKAFSGMEYGKFNETYLRDVPVEIYERYKERLPENWAKRAKHWYDEYRRVEQGAQAWKMGDIETLGRLSFESGSSSINYYETGSPELKKLYDIMTQTEGIYGGRFSGAGFKGCCMAIIDPAFRDSVTEKITHEYLKEFPALKDKFSVSVCKSADGIMHR